MHPFDGILFEPCCYNDIGTGYNYMTPVAMVKLHDYGMHYNYMSPVAMVELHCYALYGYLPTLQRKKK